MADEDLYRAMRDAAERAIAFRRHVATAERTPVAPYAEMLAAFARPTPETGLDAEAVISELGERATPGIRAKVGPRFFGWVIGDSHPVGVAADWLTAAWGQNSANIISAPAAAAVEKVACDWLLDLLDLPRESSVGLVTGATIANFVCLAAARSAVLQRAGWDVEADGLFGAPPITVILGDDAHTSVFAALKFLGLGAQRVRRVACDAQGVMQVDDFARAMDEAQGSVIAVAQAGQINTGDFDPFEEIATLGRAKGAWLHVDGAFGLWVRATQSLAHLGRGLELADSWATDGHKWLQTPYDCGYAIVRDAEAHRRAMVIAASYLPQAKDAERNPSDYAPELSRRARGFATWAMIRHLGRAGIAELVERHCRIARRMAERFRAEPGIAILNEVVLNQLIVRFGDSDQATLDTVRRIQEDAVTFMGSAQWRGQSVMRISVSSEATTEAEAEVAVDAVIAAWRAVQGAP